jgi:mutator protein MutT
MKQVINFEKPEPFCPKFEVAGCYCCFENKYLFLRYANNKKDFGGIWEVPAGKLEPGESASECVIREVYEETGIALHSRDLNFVQKVYIIYPQFDLIYHMFHVNFIERPHIKLCPREHQDAQWFSAEEFMTLPTTLGGKGCFELVLNKKNRIKTKGRFID